MSPAEMKILTSTLPRTWHFWLNLLGVVTGACVAAGVIPEIGVAHRVAAALMSILQTYGYLGAAAWQAPRRSWTEAQRINHFRDEIAAYERRQIK